MWEKVKELKYYITSTHSRYEQKDVKLVLRQNYPCTEATLYYNYKMSHILHLGTQKKMEFTE